MEIVVAVIAHEHQGVLPASGILVIGIVDGLVYHNPSLVDGGYRESSHTHILQFGSRIRSLSFAQDAQPAVAHEAMHLAERLLALIAKQIVVRIQRLTACRQHSVVPDAIAKHQQILRHIRLGLSLVVEHSQIAAIGIGIRGSAGKLVIEFISRHYRNSQPVMGFMKFFQYFSLFQ